MHNDLILAVSLVLYKFTEGEEDYTEWRDLATQLTLAALAMPNGDAKDKVFRRIDDFNLRLELQCDGN